MFATKDITIAIPLEMVKETISPVSGDGFQPRMIVTDAALTACLIRSLMNGGEAEMDQIVKDFRNMSDVDSSVDSIVELREAIESHITTMSALYLTLTNAAIIVTNESH